MSSRESYLLHLLPIEAMQKHGFEYQRQRMLTKIFQYRYVTERWISPSTVLTFFCSRNVYVSIHKRNHTSSLSHSSLWNASILTLFGDVRQSSFAWVISQFHPQRPPCVVVRHVCPHPRIRWRQLIVNTLRPRWNGRHFKDDIFKGVNENRNLIQIWSFALPTMFSEQVSSTQYLNQPDESMARRYLKSPL